MIIDTEDAVTLSHLNPLERQVLRDVADRLALRAWQRMGWMDEPHPVQGAAQPSPPPSR
ncbi:MAG: hypothetical protein ACM31D_20630 [Bacteroidota bacterium]